MSDDKWELTGQLRYMMRRYAGIAMPVIQQEWINQKKEVKWVWVPGCPADDGAAG